MEVVSEAGRGHSRLGLDDRRRRREERRLFLLNESQVSGQVEANEEAARETYLSMVLGAISRVKS